MTKYFFEKNERQGVIKDRYDHSIATLTHFSVLVPQSKTESGL